MGSDRELLTLVCASCGRIFASTVQIGAEYVRADQAEQTDGMLPDLRPRFPILEGRLPLPLQRSLAMGTASRPG